MERRKLQSTFPNFLNLKFPARPRGIQQNEIREHLGRKGPKNPEWRKQQALHQGSRVKRTSDSFLGALKLEGHVIGSEMVTISNSTPTLSNTVNMSRYAWSKKFYL